jgi:uncharacterized protein (DUF433 family)
MGKAKGKPEFVDIGTLVTRTPGVYGGRPCLKGTRMPILQIAACYLQGMSPEQMQEQYEHLDLVRIYAGYAYYLANKAAIDAELEEDQRQFDVAYAAQEAAKVQASA